MNIVVLIKQVPEIELVKVDESAGDVVLPSGPGIVNPFDEFAVEEGLRLKEKNGGKVTVITVGSEKSESALRACLALGVDEAIMISDPLFDKSDPQAVAKVLTAGLKKLGEFDLVLSGKQAVDDDSAQVPAAVAAGLDLPQVMFVKKIDSIGDGKAVVWRTTEEGYDVVETSLPAVVSVVKEINEPRLPSLKGKMTAKKAPVTKWAASDIGLDGTGVGVNSYTKKTRIAPPPPRQKGEIIEGETPEEIADKLYDKLKEKQVL
ncbi:MAG TPA: electron transfer flavoprotein subunit beta/FixA family protein [candidate division Zixibacteria bacterium]|nr:electron transfer flavoprotein subunit beta/FixA family protein [candidate division Zixibacteria bacterium]